MEIREATENDVDRIMEMDEEASEENDWWLTSKSKEDYQEMVENDERLLLVAEQNSNIVGFSNTKVFPEKKVAGARDLYVDPDHRGNRLGSKLMGRTLSRLEDEGIEEVAGDCPEEIVHFYEELGFEPNKKWVQVIKQI